MFLVGCYLMVKHAKRVKNVQQKFMNLVKGYSDVTFPLDVLDDTGAPVNDYLVNTPIEIRVY